MTSKPEYDVWVDDAGWWASNGWATLGPFTTEAVAWRQVLALAGHLFKE